MISRLKNEKDRKGWKPSRRGAGRRQNGGNRDSTEVQRAYGTLEV